MLKLMMTVKRKDGISKEAFDRYWKDHHAALVRRYAPVLGIRAYVQTVPLDNLQAQGGLQQGRGSDPVAVDGCAELWWDDLESHQALRQSEPGRAALRTLMEDEARFVDLARCQLWYGTERTIIGADLSPVPTQAPSFLPDGDFNGVGEGR